MGDKLIKTLLVEDNPGDARLVKEALKDITDQQFEIIHFPYLSPALELLENTYFDIILLDLSLPDESGINTLDRIHSVAPNTPIIVLTGMDDYDIALKSLQKGAQDYLLKSNLESDLFSRAIRYSIERAQIYAARLESEEKYRTLTDDVLDSSKVGIFILDSEYHVVWINKSVESYFGLSRKEVISKDNKKLINKKIKHIFEDPEDFSNKVLYSYNNKVKELSFECHILPAEGRKERWLEHFSQPIYSGLYAGGRIEHYTDITKRKKLEEKQSQLVTELEKTNIELRELSEIKSNFVSMVSHEFRTPLTVILAASNILKNYNERMTDEEKVSRLDKIQKEINYMVHLLNDVLIIGRVESGNFLFKPHIIDLKALCQEIIEEVATSYDSKHEIVFSCTEENKKVSLSDKLIRLIILNLLSNAVKYSTVGSKVYFDLTYGIDDVILSFKDEGIGIPEKDMEKLFEPFYRCSNVGDIHGTGLGLTIVTKSVNAHNGSIKVDSNIGKGTTIKVTIPTNLN